MKRLAEIKFDFIGFTKYTVFISAFFILAGAISLIVKGGFELGIDFAGGKNVRVQIEKSLPFDSEKMRVVFEKTKLNPAITTIGDAKDQEFFLSYQDDQKGNEAMKAILVKEIGADKFKILSEDFVGPKIGKEFQKIALQIALITILLLLIYIAFRFQVKFGVAAVIALLHDVFITLGFISILNIKFDIPILAAILTILGYSINDTIVIFDRVRENMKLTNLDQSNKTEYVALVNKSIIQSLARTLLTPFTVLIAIGVLIAFGGVELRPMAIVLAIGIIFGTYSSDFVASPLLVAWEKIFGHHKEKVKKQEQN